MIGELVIRMGDTGYMQNFGGKPLGEESLGKPLNMLILR
jgi:hypothetical protein